MMITRIRLKNGRPIMDQALPSQLDLMKKMGRPNRKWPEEDDDGEKVGEGSGG